MYKISEISQDLLEQVNTLENEMSVHIMAMEPGLEYAELNEEQLGQVQALESESGKTLLVYKG